jgi:hypothetical protein
MLVRQYRSGQSKLGATHVFVSLFDFIGSKPKANKKKIFLRRENDFAGEAKKLLDWDGATYLRGEQLQKKIIDTVTQPQDVIKRIKEILAES